MGLFKRKNEKNNNELPSLNNIVQKKLLLFITIVSSGHGSQIIKLFEKIGVSAQFVESGEGTATKEINNILGIEEVDKDVVFSFVSEDKIPLVREKLSEYFSSNKRNRGIGMAIQLSSIIGVRVYQFLANLVEDK